MQVVGRADHDSVNVLAAEHFINAGCRERHLSGEFLDLRLSFLALLSPGVAHGRHFELSIILDLDELAEKAPAAASHVGHPNPLIRAEYAAVGRRQRRGRERSRNESPSTVCG